jgi:hypothetical protein
MALMKEVVKTISFWATLLDGDGICVRFFNSNVQGNGISNQGDVEALFRTVRASGGTPMGESMLGKIIDPIVRPFLADGSLQRPVLIITVTDGVPDNRAAVVDAIKAIRTMAVRSRFGEHAVAFSFAQVGCDSGATRWLGEIDTNPEVGHLIDCTSEFSMEKRECEAKYGCEFTEAAWLVKLMIGAVDPTYDTADE